MLARTHLIQLQKALYDKLKGHARHYVGRLSPDLKYYFQEYQDNLKNYEGLTSNRQLLIDLIKCQVIFCGDYHTLSQAQRTVLRFLKSTHKILRRQKRPVYLLLEMFSPRDQKYIDAYLKGRLAEKTLLAKTKFREQWGFQWENYAPLLRFAKEHKLGVVGVHPSRQTTIKERDRFAAGLIAEITEEDPSAVLFVLMGDLHLAENHLPKEFDRVLKSKKLKRNAIVVHQNNERFYWSLVEQGLERFVEVIKVKSGVYCVMNTPPWVKLQSHLKWVEAVAEGAGPKGHARDYARAIDSLDHSHEIDEALKLLRDFFEVADPIDDDFHIRGPLDLSFLEDLSKNKAFSKRELKILTAALGEFDSQYFPRSNDLFLTNLGMNHLTAQTAFFLHSKLSGFKGIFEKPRRDFYTFVWIEALAFLCTKLLNPKRKVPSEAELRRLLRTARKKGEGRSSTSKALQFVLLHLERERRMKAKGDTAFTLRVSDGELSVDSIIMYYKASKLLGTLLGGALYASLYEGRVGKDEIRELFYCPFTPFHEPKRLYTKWVIRLDAYQYRDLV